MLIHGAGPCCRIILPYIKCVCPFATIDSTRLGFCSAPTPFLLLSPTSHIYIQALLPLLLLIYIIDLVHCQQLAIRGIDFKRGSGTTARDQTKLPLWAQSNCQPPAHIRSCSSPLPPLSLSLSSCLSFSFTLTIVFTASPSAH